MKSAAVVRKLAAILAADMVGYSRLMERDETDTIARQKAYQQQLTDPLVAEYHGRIVKTTGDGWLAEFPSVVDAVDCAVEFQDRITSAENNVPADRRIQYRVGVNLGDIVLDSDDIFGDGVNVAARLETLAAPGKVVVSGAAFDQIKKKLNVGYRYLGTRKVKNISEPVRIYCVLPGETAGRVLGERRVSAIGRRWLSVAAVVSLVATIALSLTWRSPEQRIESAVIERMALPLPEKPSIAVLAFERSPDDEKTARLAHAMTEDTNIALSKLSEMFVIAADATKSFDSRSARPRDVAEALGVRYVLQGRVETDGKRLRVTSRLSDAVSGRVVWADRYDRNMTDLFAIRDEVVLNVVSEVGATISQGERDRILRRGTDSLEAWLLVREAAYRISLLAPEHVKPAEEMAKRAIAIDPDYAEAYAALAGVYRQWGQNWPGERSREQLFALSERVGAKALQLDPENDYANMRLATLQFARAQHDQALQSIAKAVGLMPNNWINQGVYGWILNHSSQPRKGYSHLQLAERLNPDAAPYWVLREIAHSQQLLGLVDQALETLREVLRRKPDRVTAMLAHVRSAIMLYERDAIEQARDSIRRALEVFPGTSIAFLHESRPYRNPDIYRRWDPILRELGLPESRSRH